jgi:FKBP-type peptidyl-prolyl cis-trans isomerase FkpA
LEKNSMTRSVRRTRLAVPIVAVALLLSAPIPAEESAAPPATDRERVLYALGAALGQQLKQFSLSEDEYENLSRGLRDAALNRELQVDLMAMEEDVRAFHQERVAGLIAKERAAAAAFVEEAAHQKGAVQTASGLVFRDLVAGTGASPEPTSVVKVHYHGTLRDGTVFDSTVVTGTPATFPLDRVIPCWQEGLVRMKVGGKSQLVCPPEIAYGDNGFPPAIPGGAALSFEVELVDVVR